MLRMVRRVPMGTRGKMRLEFEIVNPELLDSYVEFVRTKYERDILAAIIKKQKEKKSSSAVVNLRFKLCEQLFVNALSFLFLSQNK